MDDGTRQRAERVRRVFGDVLPDTTADERTDDDTEPEADRERWYRENRPPHHE